MFEPSLENCEQELLVSSNRDNHMGFLCRKQGVEDDKCKPI